LTTAPWTQITAARAEGGGLHFGFNQGEDADMVKLKRLAVDRQKNFPAAAGRRGMKHRECAIVTSKGNR
jgi:hypothetical protein